MLLKHRGEYPSLPTAIESIALKIGGVPQTLLGWLQRQAVYMGARAGLTTSDAQAAADVEYKDDGARIRNCFNAGYSDGFSGAKANPPAWDTVPAWSNAYAEGYSLGAEARRKIRPHQNTQQPLI